MDKLRAPWCMKYISTIDKKDEGCIFCTKPDPFPVRTLFCNHEPVPVQQRTPAYSSLQTYGFD